MQHCQSTLTCIRATNHQPSTHRAECTQGTYPLKSTGARSLTCLYCTKPKKIRYQQARSAQTGIGRVVQTERVRWRTICQFSNPRSFHIDEEVHSAPEAYQRRKRAAPTICCGRSDLWFFGGPSYELNSVYKDTQIQITDIRSTDKTCLETNA